MQKSPVIANVDQFDAWGQILKNTESQSPQRLQSGPTQWWGGRRPPASMRQRFCLCFKLGSQACNFYHSVRLILRGTLLGMKNLSFRCCYVTTFDQLFTNSVKQHTRHVDQILEHHFLRISQTTPNDAGGRMRVVEVQGRWGIGGEDK